MRWTDGELITKQVEFTGNEIEERADSGIGLAVVVAKVAFVITRVV